VRDAARSDAAQTRDLGADKQNVRQSATLHGSLAWRRDPGSRYARPGWHRGMWGLRNA